MNTARSAPQPIDVVVQRHDAPFVAPLAAYAALRGHFGEDNTFLLESLSGPQRDTASAQVGCFPIFGIDARGDELTLRGCPALVHEITTLLLTVCKKHGDSLIVNQDSSLWHVLRLIRSLFNVRTDAYGARYGFGFFGLLGFDTTRYIEEITRRIPPTTSCPDISLAIFSTLLDFDLNSRTMKIACATSTFWTSHELSDLRDMLSKAPPLETLTIVPEAPTPFHIERTVSRQQYFKNVVTALHHVGIGDIYQVQLGHEVNISTTIDSLSVYQRLRHRNPSPYMYLATLGGQTIVGASPELFVRVERGLITMRPVAGTARRCATPQEDEEAVRRLKSDQKEAAEHIMLVDLCRNDIGRVCNYGTLAVDELMAVEQYSTVYHLVSNVTGVLRAEFDAFDVIKATFPAGTMTGAPKVRAIEIIEDLETTRRGAYAGAIGFIDFNNYVNMALCIRTAVKRGEQYSVRASAGTVADSNPEYEWKETIAKINSTYWAIAGEALKP
jgi:anthranilate/para-aminobenzoate synthase component I